MDRHTWSLFNHFSTWKKHVRSEVPNAWDEKNTTYLTWLRVSEFWIPPGKTRGNCLVDKDLDNSDEYPLWIGMLPNLSFVNKAWLKTKHHLNDEFKSSWNQLHKACWFLCLFNQLEEKATRIIPFLNMFPHYWPPLPVKKGAGFRTCRCVRFHVDDSPLHRSLPDIGTTPLVPGEFRCSSPLVFLWSFPEGTHNLRRFNPQTNKTESQ